MISMKTITVADLRTALLDLRKRTGDNSLGHTVKAGKFQLCRVTYGKGGKSEVLALSRWQDAAGHMAEIQNFKA